MIEYIVSINLCNGSMAEAATPCGAIGPFSRRETAQLVADGIYHAAAVNDHLEEYLLVSVVKLDRPSNYLYDQRITHTSRRDMNQAAIDCEKIVREYFSSYLEDDDDPQTYAIARDVAPLNASTLTPADLKRLLGL